MKYSAEGDKMKRHWLATGLLLSILVVGNCWAKYKENPDIVYIHIIPMVKDSCYLH